MSSTTVIKNFVSFFNLQDEYSNIRFHANVFISTEKTKQCFSSEIIIHFRDFNSAGKVEIEEVFEKIPNSFEGKYQNFNFIDNKYLEIKGVHSIDKEIGKYEVYIFPIA